jgi:hypothetical protein
MSERDIAQAGLALTVVSLMVCVGQLTVGILGLPGGSGVPVSSLASPVLSVSPSPSSSSSFLDTPAEGPICLMGPDCWLGERRGWLAQQARELVAAVFAGQDAVGPFPER